jgi:Fur family peroxide stress response transcriptional regulator
MPQTRNLDQRITALLRRQHLLTAADISEQLDAHGASYNPTSIYRALQRLLEAGEICEHNFGTSSSYELRDDHHAHLICNSCGDVTAADCTFVEPTAEELGGFEMEHHHVEVYGVCEGCRE